MSENAEFHIQYPFALLPLRRAVREHQFPLPQMPGPRALVPAQGVALQSANLAPASTEEVI